MLNKNQRQWVERDRALYDGDKRSKDQRIRNTAKKALSDLAFLAKELDPSQHKQVFTLKNLEPLAEALHNYSTKEKDRFEGKKDAIVCNKELFDVGITMSNWLLSMSRNLVNERYYELIWGTGERVLPPRTDIDGLTTVFFATEHGENRKNK